MKTSRDWLQKYFEKPLPSAEAIAEAFTFHSFEIEGIEGGILDVKVLPNRAADCLSHRGIAKELSAILDIPLKHDPLREKAVLGSPTPGLRVTIADENRCSRYIGAVVKGVKVGPSPEWLRKALESVGQRSINNVVDATNYVMLDIGQPLHAFDAGKLVANAGTYAIGVRAAHPHELMHALDGIKYELTDSMLVIADDNDDEPIGIAGVKGGMPAGISESTKDIIVESANFDGTSVRRTAQALKLFTDASLRFQNRPSPELAAYGMQAVLALIQEIAGGEIAGVVDIYPKKPEQKAVSITAETISKDLGAAYSEEDLASVFTRLGLPFTRSGASFSVMPPFERTDITIPEDLIEEVGRIIGYDRVPATPLAPVDDVPDQSRFRGIERMKDELVEKGFTEVSTQSFAKKGEVYLANPLDKTMPALRTSLEANLKDALERAKQYAPLVLPPNEKPKLFEAGTVFSKDGEHIELRTTEGTSEDLFAAKLENYGKGYVPKRYELGPYKPFSPYPFVLRDVALWVLEGTEPAAVGTALQENAGPLLVRCDLFDTFKKDGRISYAFRLVFESHEKTLTDEEVNRCMEGVTAVITQKGWEVR